MFKTNSVSNIDEPLGFAIKELIADAKSIPESQYLSILYVNIIKLKCVENWITYKTNEKCHKKKPHKTPYTVSSAYIKRKQISNRKHHTLV